MSGLRSDDNVARNAPVGLVLGDDDERAVKLYVRK